MIDIFSDSKLVLRRAQKHIIDLEQRIKVFLDTQPYSAVTEADPDGVHYLHKVKLTKSLPNEFAVITADAVNNLRIALDQAWYAIAVACKAIGPTEQAYFPIANSLADFERMLKKRWAENFNQDILALLRGFQPYKGGNDFIWALNRICAANKHRMLAPIGVKSGGMNIGHAQISGSADAPARILIPKWDIVKQEVIFAITTPSTLIEYHNLQFSLYIAFYEVDIVGGYPVLGILSNLLSIVNSILGALEAETRRLGFI
jgi:hypothetical protein